MDGLSTTVAAALGLLVSDPAIWRIIGLSLSVSMSAVAISAAIGIPLGYALGVARSHGSRILLAVVNTGMALPPVVAGLFVFILLSRSGPLGFFELLFTVQAMIVAQVVIAAPLVAGVTAASVGAVPKNLRLQARSLGASRVQEAVVTLKESKKGIVAALIAGFGGVISEVGAVMLVGGNIEGSTRVMTTAIVLETRQGHFADAIALGLVLVGLAFVINGMLTTVQHAGVRHER